MTESPSELDQDSSGRASSTAGNAASHRLAILRAEAGAATAESKKAELHYEAGNVLEHELHQDALAVREYLTAFNLDPTFRPPLFALIRVFEERKSATNLKRLYDAESNAADMDSDRASAMIDLAVLLEDQEADMAGAIATLESALSLDPTNLTAAIMLERLGRRNGEVELADRALLARATHSQEPIIQSLLWVELAQAAEARGDLDVAFGHFRSAVEVPAGRWRALEFMERVARKHKRYPECVQAVEARAHLASAIAKGEDQGQASGAFSVQTISDAAHAKITAGALWHEAARMRLSFLGDGEGAVAALGSALELAPSDLVLRQEKMLAHEVAGDLPGAVAEAEGILGLGVTGPYAAALHFRRAELAQANEDPVGAKEALVESLAADPTSGAAAALLGVLLLDQGAHAERVNELESRGEAAEGHAKYLPYFQAAWIAAEELADFERAAKNFRISIEHASDPLVVLREFYGSALRHGQIEPAVEALDKLLQLELDDDERAALRRDRYELYSTVLEDPAAAMRVLVEALDDDACLQWAPTIARLIGARDGDSELLCRAHLAISRIARDDETSAAHLCAASRALARGNKGNTEQVERAILIAQQALEKRPGHAYAVALLEELFTSQGQAGQVVAMLREAASAQASSRSAEANLLLAGSRAIDTGDAELAIKTYREALALDPLATGGAYALRDLARATKNAALELEATAILSEREIALGSPGPETLELAELKDLVEKKSGEAVEPLTAALESDSVGTNAALALSLLPGRSIGPGARLNGLWKLRQAVEKEHPALAEGQDVAMALPTGLGGADGPSPRVGRLMDRAAALEALEVGDERLSVLLDGLRERYPDDPFAPFAQIMFTSKVGALAPELGVGESELDSDQPAGDSEDPSDSEADWGNVSPMPTESESPRIMGWLGLARATDDDNAAADLGLMVVRAQLIQSSGGSASTGDDAFLTAQEIAATSPESVFAGIALSETLSAADDPETWIEALTARLAHTPDTLRGSVSAALGRALVTAGRTDEALTVLEELVQADPTDYASWDFIRVAARAEARWPSVVAACDALAEKSEGEWRAQLLEEAAAVLMDWMGDDQGAEERLREALPGGTYRPIAYGRLHDLLAEQGKTSDLAELVRARIESLEKEPASVPAAPGDIDAIGADERPSPDTDELQRLHYERARLLRSEGDLAGALGSLSQLFLVDPVHVGGLALEAETHVAMSRFRDAVGSLQRLAAADVPDSQRRIAHLGAADFLTKKLDDPTGALKELGKIIDLGLGDTNLHVRMADVAEAAGLFEQADQSLIGASTSCPDPELQALYRRRAGKIRESHLSDVAGATDAYRSALSYAPSDLASAEALVLLLTEPSERDEAIDAFEMASRREVDRNPADEAAIRKLHAVGRFRRDNTLCWATLSALVAIGSATEEEKSSCATLSTRLPVVPTTTLTDADRATLQSPGAAGPLREAMRLAQETIGAMDQWDASRFGVEKANFVSSRKPSELRDAIGTVSRPLGVEVEELFVGGDDPNRIELLASKKGRATWVIGEQVGLLFTQSDRFTICRLAASFTDGTLFCNRRSVHDSAAVLAATLLACEVDVPGARSRPNVSELAAGLARRLPRKVRKAVPGIVSGFDGNFDSLENWVRASLGTSVRAGALLSGDLSKAIVERTGGLLSPGAVRSSAETRELLSFWMARDTLVLRHRLGLAL